MKKLNGLLTEFNVEQLDLSAMIDLVSESVVKSSAFYVYCEKKFKIIVSK